MTYESINQNDKVYINFKNVIELDNHIADLDYINIGIYEHETMITPTIEPNESQNIEINQYSIANIDYVSVSKDEYIISDFNENKTIQIVIFDSDGNVSYISHYDTNEIN